MTRIPGDALAAVLQDDVTATVEAVRRASVRVAGDREDTDIDLRVDVDERADLQHVRRQIETEVLPRFTRAAGLGRATTYLDLRLDASTQHVR